MFAVCFDERIKKYKLMRLPNARKYPFIQIISIHNTYRQAESARVELLGKSSARLGDIVRRKD